MATISEIVASRQAAGERYATAARELIAAMIDLGGYDFALSNANMPTPENLRPVKTFVFGGSSENFHRMLEHPEFAVFGKGTGLISGAQMNEAIRVRHDEVIATLAAE